MRSNEEVMTIVARWETDGSKYFNHGKDGPIPACPELVYRMSGNWKGWNAFLELHPGDDTYAENMMSDWNEDEAWEIFKKRHSNN